MTVLCFASMMVPMLVVGDIPKDAPPIRVVPDAVYHSPADDAERHRRFEDQYERIRRAYETNADDASAREMLRTMQRHRSWQARMQDPGFRRFVLTLKPTEALDLYAEVLEKLSTLFAVRERARPEVLFRFGIEELDKSLGVPEFAALHFPNTSRDQLRAFRRFIQERAAKIGTIAEARDAVFELVRVAGRDFGLTTPAAVVLEMLCGACRRIDDYSEFQYPQSDQPMMHEPSVEAFLLPGKVGLGYLRIARFRESTPRELDEAMEQLRMQGMRGLIVDLRGNPGGLLTAAVSTATRFQAHGIVATTTGQVPEFADRVFSSDSGSGACDLPLVVLVDRRTMSAAEVVAAAWKESGRAMLVGMSTFGKGAVQPAPIPLHAADRPDQLGRSGTLVVTAAHVYGPGKTPIERVGIQPHHTESDPTRQLEVGIVKLQELAAMRR